MHIYILSGNKYKYLIQTNISCMGNVMTNSMQATLSKAIIYIKQPTKEWGDPTWHQCKCTIEIVWEWERKTTMNVGLVWDLREEQSFAAYEIF